MAPKLSGRFGTLMLRRGAPRRDAWVKGLPVISDAAPVAERMARLLAERPRTFYELLRELPDVEYRTVLIAWGSLRERRALGRDAHGRYLIRAS